MREDYESIGKAGASVIAIGPDSQDSFRSYFEENQIPFVGLSDPEENVLKSLGQEKNLLKFGRLPAFLLVDNEMTIRYIHYGEKTSDIIDGDTLLALIRNIKSGKLKAPGILKDAKKPVKR